MFIVFVDQQQNSRKTKGQSFPRTTADDIVRSRWPGFSKPPTRSVVVYYDSLFKICHIKIYYHYLLLNSIIWTNHMSILGFN